MSRNFLRTRVSTFSVGCNFIDPEELPARAKVEQWLDWNQCRLSPTVAEIVLAAMKLAMQSRNSPRVIRTLALLS